ncbi:hypothetical protein BKA62DRAFT_696175 [Auriculariales sp. MPI-PUGE-AT-0066]|nr:hypothetical protein BKA62DRAFT_696175 [Auriculariales sp. MPI-PUGE-AT-0066]
MQPSTAASSNDLSLEHQQEVDLGSRETESIGLLHDLSRRVDEARVALRKAQNQLSSSSALRQTYKVQLVQTMELHTIVAKRVSRLEHNANEIQLLQHQSGLDDVAQEALVLKLEMMEQILQHTRRAMESTQTAVEVARRKCDESNTDVSAQSTAVKEEVRHLEELEAKRLDQLRAVWQLLSQSEHEQSFGATSYQISPAPSDMALSTSSHSDVGSRHPLPPEASESPEISPPSPTTRAGNPTSPLRNLLLNRIQPRPRPVLSSEGTG